MAYVGLMQVVHKAVHSLVAFGNVVRAMQPRQMLIDAAVQIGARGQSGMKGEVLEPSK